MPVKNHERRTVRGKTVSYIHKGNQRVEFLTTNRDPQLRQELRRACSKSRYTTGKAHETPRGTLLCHLMPTKVKDFQQLIDKIVHVIVSKIESYEQMAVRGNQITKKITKAVKKAVKTSRKSKGSRSVSMKGHRYRALNI